MVGFPERQTLACPHREECSERPELRVLIGRARAIREPGTVRAGKGSGRWHGCCSRRVWVAILEEVMMDDATWTSERERIAYRRGFDDGLAAMREKIKDLLLENDRLRMPLLDGSSHSGASRDPSGSRICLTSGAELTRYNLSGGNGRGGA